MRHAARHERAHRGAEFTTCLRVRKFLRSPDAEYAACLDVVRRLAIITPESVLGAGA